MSQSSPLQVGMDDVLHPWFERHSLEAQQACLQQGSNAGCRAVLQQGAVAAVRPQLWSTALALPLPDAQLEERFQQLCSQAEQCHLLTDLLVSHAALTLHAISYGPQQSDVGHNAEVHLSF